MSRRPLLWLGSSRKDVRAFPVAARRKVGHELDLLQQGLEPTDWKPFVTIGDGVSELRVRADGAFRVIYVAKFSDGIHVLHAFQKKTQRTSHLDIELARKRFRQLANQRRQR